MDTILNLIYHFELHDVEAIDDCFKKGINPNQMYKGMPLIFELINMYTRGSRFKNCIQVFVRHGLIFDDNCLLAVLLDDVEKLKSALDNDRTLMNKRYNFDCTFTPLYDATLLHICAEYGHLACTKVLLEYGMDINTQAGYDKNGFGGQTAIFHTVNQDDNKGMDVLQYLLSKDADTSLTVQGLIWGKGYPWETYIPSVNPISYAMMGLLRQFQRTENQIYKVVSLLMEARYGIKYLSQNIPNAYLHEK